MNVFGDLEIESSSMETDRDLERDFLEMKSYIESKSMEMRDMEIKLKEMESELERESITETSSEQVERVLMMAASTELEIAALSGDVELLKRAVQSYPNPPYNDDYFLDTPHMGGWNIFHYAVCSQKVEFIREGIKTIPSRLLLQLLSKSDFYGCNPLHIAAETESDEMVGEIVGFYKSYLGSLLPLEKRPWLAIDFQKKSPLHKALNGGKEERAMEIMSMDMELLCSMIDEENNSPLFLAVVRGFNRVAEKILCSDFSYSLSGINGFTPLHYAAFSSENVLQLLLKRHDDLLNVISDDFSYNVLHNWALFTAVWPIECLLKWDFPSVRTKMFMDLVYKTEKENGDNPLHTAVRANNIKFLEALVRGYQQEVSSGKSSESLNEPPWKIKNNDGDTPFYLAISLQHEEAALCFLSYDPILCQVKNDKGESTISLAIASGFNEQVVEQILKSQDRISPQNRNLDLQWLKVYPEGELRYLLQKYPSFVVNAVDNEIGLNVLHIWSEMEQVWPINYLLERQIPYVTRKVFTDFMYMVDKEKGDTPLHVAARKGDIHIVQALVSGYQQEINAEKTSKSLDEHPWKIKNKYEDTPFHVALSSKHKEISLYFLSVDPTLCQMSNDKGESMLFFALASGVVEQVFEEIMKTHDRFSPPERKFDLQWLKICPEHILRYLLENYPSFMDNVDHKNGFNAIHQWAELGQAWPLNLFEHDFLHLRTKVFREYISIIDNMGDTPLHIAARTNIDPDFVQALVSGYRREVGETVKSHECPFLKSKNINGDTPLHVALSLKNKNIAFYIFSLDPTLCDVHNNNGESPLFVAVASGCEHFIEEFLGTRFCSLNMLLRNDKKTVLHCLSSCTERTCKHLLRKFWWLIDVRDENGRTALDEAKEVNVPWLITLLENPSLFQKEPFDWVVACKRNEISTLLAFIDNCPDLQSICREQQDTPLHHIKLQTYKDYQNFLKIPSFALLKNMIDREGATPLHRALQRRDINLSKALLTDNTVERNIKDCNGRTAMDLLARLWKDHVDWANMCEEIKVYPYLKTRYIQPGTNMDQMRNTLTVVAALLATITFAAGFTLPGGLDGNTGYAMFGKKAAFLVFLLADAYAMCTSVVVLFCLIWSMISERDMSYFLVDRSVVILMQSLYGTMLAFMTGIYVVTSNKSLWAAIIVLILCALIGVSVNRTVLHKILVVILPASNIDDEDRIHYSEEGIPLTSFEDNDEQV